MSQEHLAAKKQSLATVSETTYNIKSCFIIHYSISVSLQNLYEETTSRVLSVPLFTVLSALLLIMALADFQCLSVAA